MQKFYRFQVGHYTLEEMQNYNSTDRGECWEEEGMEIPEGICACSSPFELLRNTVWGIVDGCEVVEFRGQKVVDIYDGCRVYPIEIVRYWTPAEFEAAAWAGEIEEE